MAPLQKKTFQNLCLLKRMAKSRSKPQAQVQGTVVFQSFKSCAVFIIFIPQPDLPLHNRSKTLFEGSSKLLKPVLLTSQLAQSTIHCVTRRFCSRRHFHEYRLRSGALNKNVTAKSDILQRIFKSVTLCFFLDTALTLHLLSI